MQTTQRLFTIALICLLACAPPLVAQGSPVGVYVTTLPRAEAATRAGNWLDAATLWADVVAVNPTDGRFWNELANARANTGALDEAIRAYEQSIKLGWGIPGITAYRIATLHARNRDKESALAWLDGGLGGLIGCPSLCDFGSAVKVPDRGGGDESIKAFTVNQPGTADHVAGNLTAVQDLI